MIIIEYGREHNKCKFLSLTGAVKRLLQTTTATIIYPVFSPTYTNLAQCTIYSKKHHQPTTCIIIPKQTKPLPNFGDRHNGQELLLQTCLISTIRRLLYVCVCVCVLEYLNRVAVVEVALVVVLQNYRVRALRSLCVMQALFHDERTNQSHAVRLLVRSFSL